MNRTQWMRCQRYKKATDEAFADVDDCNKKGKQKVVEVADKRKTFSPPYERNFC